MKHGRDDYNRRIQDLARQIPPGEPVFLLRGQDRIAPLVVKVWADLAKKVGASNKIVDSALAQAKAMEEWQEKQGSHAPDL